MKHKHITNDPNWLTTCKEKLSIMVKTILKSAKLSNLVNGSTYGYFDCGIALLFCIAKDILSRGLLKLRRDGKLNYISSPRGTIVPSHVFYVSDLIVFCREDKRGISNHLELCERDGEASYQIVNMEKNSIFFCKGITRKQTLLDILNIQEG